jgi:hypothetical protein
MFDIIKLSIKQAKLGITEEKHSSRLPLNKRIKLLLSKPQQYNNNDFNIPADLKFSPNKKRVYLTKWKNSQSHYIIVRTLDYSELIQE